MSNVIYSFVRKTNLFLLFLFWFTLQSSATGNSQKVTLYGKNLSIEQIFNEIRQQTDYMFLYNKEMVKHASLVTLNVKNAPLEEVLDICFENQPFSYRIKDKIIVLTIDNNNKKSIEIKKSISVPPIKVTGRISDKNGQPVSGASVSIKGTNAGAVTDQDGYYHIMAPEKSIITFSYIGFQSIEMEVNSKNNIDVVLELLNNDLSNEVVVVGYGSRSKRVITGSVSSIDMTKQADLPNTNITQALRGKVAGVQFTDGGRPGQEGSILVRGRNSLSASSAPLIVLDGIIFNGSLSDINPNDIQSIDILKDASSAAIYGSRAANGVILITSKKGITEKPFINLNSFTGISEYGHKVKLLSPERYLQRIVDYRTQTGVEVDPSKIENYLTKTEADNYALGITRDPWDQASQKGKIESYDLSISGKSKSFNYYISASIADEKGLIFNDNHKRTSFRVNIDNRVTNWLSIGTNSTFSRRDMSGLSANLSNAYVSSPYGTWFHPDGEPTQYVVAEEQVSANPIRSSILTTNEEISDNLFANFYARINVPFINGLEYRVNYSPNFRWQHDYNFFRQDKHLANNTTNASKLNRNNFDWMLENIITYRKTIGNDHSFDVTMLYGMNHSKTESTTASANLLSTDVLGYHDLSLGNILTSASNASEYGGISYMARINYLLKNKYVVTLTARRDGSSVFAVNNKYATFPSGSLAWIISDEPFMNNNRFINMLKLRLSYGSVGNQAINPYQSLSLSEITQYVYGDGGLTSIGIFPSTMGNDNLKWETTNKANAAIDFSLFKGRVGGTFEVYTSKTTDLLVQRSISSLTGFNTIFTNIGQVNNKGIEITLNTVNIQTNKFEWSSNIVFSTNQNKIEHLFGADANNDGIEDDDLTNNWFIGQPINSYYDYVFDGIYQEGDVIPDGYKPGWVRLKDLNGDKKIDAKDRTVVGSGGNPRYRFGITNNFRYGNLSLSIFVNAMTGWVSPFSMLEPSTTGRSLNQLDDDWWTSENKSNTRASLVYTNPLKHSWYISRDFLRIQDVSLSYEFPRTVIDKIKISSLRVFLSGKNVYTFTNWLGSDPESGGNTAETLYPMPRSFTAGINIGL